MSIVGFACQWCAYQAADLAGNLKLSYPSTIRLIRVPCSGRVEAEFVLRALASGADAAFIAGCPHAECHYRNGSRIAKIKVSILKNLLPELGIESGRLEFLQVSSAEAKRFVEFAREMDERVRKLGRSPLGDLHD